jgi:hypothetical protein
VEIRRKYPIYGVVYSLNKMEKNIRNLPIKVDYNRVSENFATEIRYDDLVPIISECLTRNNVVFDSHSSEFIISSYGYGSSKLSGRIYFTRIPNDLFLNSPPDTLNGTNHSQTPMDAFNKYILQQEYNKLAKLGDRLAKADQLANVEALVPHFTRPIAKLSLLRTLYSQLGYVNFKRLV